MTCRNAFRNKRTKKNKREKSYRIKSKNMKLKFRYNYKNRTQKGGVKRKRSGFFPEWDDNSGDEASPDSHFTPRRPPPPRVWKFETEEEAAKAEEEFLKKKDEICKNMEEVITKRYNDTLSLWEEIKESFKCGICEISHVQSDIKKCINPKCANGMCKGCLYKTSQQKNPYGVLKFKILEDITCPFCIGRYPEEIHAEIHKCQTDISKNDRKAYKWNTEYEKLYDSDNNSRDNSSSDAIRVYGSRAAKKRALKLQKEKAVFDAADYMESLDTPSSGYYTMEAHIDKITRTHRDVLAHIDKVCSQLKSNDAIDPTQTVLDSITNILRNNDGEFLRLIDALFPSTFSKVPSGYTKFDSIFSPLSFQPPAATAPVLTDKERDAIKVGLKLENNVSSRCGV